MTTEKAPKSATESQAAVQDPWGGPGLCSCRGGRERKEGAGEEWGGASEATQAETRRTEGQAEVSPVPVELVCIDAG